MTLVFSSCFFNHFCNRLFVFQTFRKTLASVFREKLNLDVVFFETAIYLWKFPHVVLECIPVPWETGDLAPIYFKVKKSTIHFHFHKILPLDSILSKMNPVHPHTVSFKTTLALSSLSTHTHARTHNSLSLVS
jgi:hypothetical protein